NAQGFSILGVTHCTSNPYGAACADVINRAYGNFDIPIGTLQKPGFLEDGQRYNRPLAERYPHRFAGGAAAPDAAEVMRAALKDQPDQSVVLIAVGPLTNAASFIVQEVDRDLIRRKVIRLVAMAGCFSDKPGMPGVEWNVEMDVGAARFVVDNWPTPVDFSPFETGAPVMTGVHWHGMPEDHPVRRAYALHSPNGRNSWDPATVWAAVMGDSEYFAFTPRGDVAMDSNGRTAFAENPDGRFRVLRLVGDPQEAGKLLDAWIAGANGAVPAF
ncbi:MAG TPA: nucleoside hydrolase, partial [Clostridia bacterium]|nr:nucleoside hydrolase [Clostridia bacterium]